MCGQTKAACGGKGAGKAGEMSLGQDSFLTPLLGGWMFDRSKDVVVFQTKDRILAEYALRDIHKPIGVDWTISTGAYIIRPFAKL